MTLDIHKQCVVCAWRATCGKKHTIRETALHCPDFTRDLSLEAEGSSGQTTERHKQVEDVFGTRK
jgi:hypothetical protein